MIESIEFSNFKALRNTKVPFAPFTLLLGPNGSGKSSVLQGLQSIANLSGQPNSSLPNWSSLVSVTSENNISPIIIKARVRLKNKVGFGTFQWISEAGPGTVKLHDENGNGLTTEDAADFRRWLANMQTFSLDATALAQACPVNNQPMLSNGYGLAAALDKLKDDHPESWKSLLDEMREWLPEYDNILFDRQNPGQKTIVLRTKKGGHRIPALGLSQGTLIALALLTLAYSPDPPTLIGLEEIDRGLHPRLLRHLQDAMYRLAYPESSGEKRPPVQVIATTHSPYMLDLYREHPEEVVLAEKDGLEVKMTRLTDIDHYDEILGEAPLSEVWYSGVLGGVSVKP